MTSLCAREASGSRSSRGGSCLDACNSIGRSFLIKSNESTQTAAIDQSDWIEQYEPVLANEVEANKEGVKYRRFDADEDSCEEGKGYEGGHWIFKTSFLRQKAEKLGIVGAVPA